MLFSLARINAFWICKNEPVLASIKTKYWNFFYILNTAIVIQARRQVFDIGAANWIFKKKGGGAYFS